MATVAIPDQAEFPHRRQTGESLAEALHPPSLVIHCNNQRRIAQSMNIRGQLLQLLAGFEIAAEENDATDQRMQQPLAVICI